MKRRVLVIGGAGSVGKRILRLLRAIPDTELLIVGRDRDHATEIADEYHERKVPVRAVGEDDIAALAPDLVIDASGPFQGRDYAIPRACIRARVAYLDIADDRAFVTGIGALDEEATAAGVPVLSGAGMLPSLSMAAASTLAEDLDAVGGVQVWFCPGNQQNFGSAACASLLAATGREFSCRSEGAWRTMRGWQGLRLAKFPMLGWRLLGPMDAPDVALLPERWPDLREATVHGSAELPPLQLGLFLLSWLPRLGAPNAIAKLGALPEGMARSLGHFGGLNTGLRVIVVGRRGETEVQRSWSLIARAGDGAFLPAAPVVALARRILNGPAPLPGARVAAPTLHEILAELRDRDIQVRMTDTAPQLAWVDWEAMVTALGASLREAWRHRHVLVPRFAGPLARPPKPGRLKVRWLLGRTKHDSAPRLVPHEPPGT